MPPAIAFENARSSAEVFAAASTFLEGDDPCAALDHLGIANRKLGSADDLERFIEQVRSALDTLPMTDRDEGRAHRLLGYLMLASFRAHQLA